MDWVRDSWIWIIIGLFLVWMLFKMLGHHGRRSAHEGGPGHEAHGGGHEGHGGGGEAHGGCCGGGEVDSDPRKREVGRPT